MKLSNVKKIAVFASGGGSNAREIFKHFKSIDDIDVILCVTNKPEAGVINYANEYGVRVAVYDDAQFVSGELVCQELLDEGVEFIALAGFLRKIPSVLTDNFEDRILNIHPALLPNYGGKGMYGMNVHRAVKESGDAVSGPTIHLVNEKFDDGATLAQFETQISPNDSPEDIAEKVLKLEHQYFAKVIESYIRESIN